MLNLIGAAISGLVIGGLARWIYWGPVDMGWIETILLGIGGSIVANLAITRGRPGEGVDRAGCIASVVGAMVIIFLVRVLQGGL
jgi:uncharacterized membrane protein YeaQ/YmgE (transglycosylase-associated protein family)